MNEFDILLDLHNEIDAVFFRHQCSLLNFDFIRALEELEEYESLLIRHIKDEEEFLLPIYAERAKVEKAGEAKIFLDDHEKMRAYIEQFKEQTIKLAGEEHPENGLLLLLDRESFYKRLNSHHDKREREHLYPSLNMICSQSEKDELLSHLMCKVKEDDAASQAQIPV